MCPVLLESLLPEERRQLASVMHAMQHGLSQHLSFAGLERAKSDGDRCSPLVGSACREKALKLAEC